MKRKTAFKICLSNFNVQRYDSKCLATLLLIRDIQNRNKAEAKAALSRSHSIQRWGGAVQVVDMLSTRCLHGVYMLSTRCLHVVYTLYTLCLLSCLHVVY
jgi:hypothetical protein